MYPEDLESLLREITVSAIEHDAEGAEEPEDLIFAIEQAVATRKIVDCVQFEELWEQTVDPEVDDSGVSFFFIGLKLSPEVCEEAQELDASMNEVSWTLLIPNVDSLNDAERPQTAKDLLALAEIDIPNKSTTDYEILKEIIQFDDPGPTLH